LLLILYFCSRKFENKIQLNKEINKKILRLAIPSIIANITIPLVGMTDLVIAGHLGAAVIISGIAIGGMLFDLLYWNFGFLRLGTSGFTAQAYGRHDLRDAVKIFMEACGAAIISALLILILQYPVLKYSFYVVPCSPEVAAFAREYFLVRIWAVPAVMLLFVIRGWFIGMQNSVSPMIIDVVVNGVNVGISLLFVIVYKMGIFGLALGTVVAQYVGLLVGFSLLAFQYGKLRRYVEWAHFLRFREMKNFFMVNGDIFIRSLGMLVIYNGFTILSAQYGDEALATNTILLKIMMLYSFFLDGFAYAGEALAGRCIGAKDSLRLKLSIRLLFIWSFAVGIVSCFVYAFGFENIVRLVTSNETVIALSHDFYWWVVIMPIVSCVAFMWDGIYIGATASAPMRNIMIVSVLLSIVTYYAFASILGIHAIWLAYTVHLVVRSVGEQLLAKRNVYVKAL